MHKFVDLSEIKVIYCVAIAAFTKLLVIKSYVNIVTSQCELTYHLSQVDPILALIFLVTYGIRTCISACTIEN